MPFALHAVKTKQRLLTVSESTQHQPKIVLSGAWLGLWGFIFGDRLSVSFVTRGYLVVKVEPIYESSDCAPEDGQQIAPIAGLPILKNRKPHQATVSISDRYFPKVTLTGPWLRIWGITTGDRICVTKEANGIITIQLDMPAAKWRQLQKNKKIDREAANVLAVIKQYQAQYAALFQQASISKNNRAADPRPARPTEQSVLKQITTGTSYHNAAVETRLANLSRAS